MIARPVTYAERLVRTARWAILGEQGASRCAYANQAPNLGIDLRFGAATSNAVVKTDAWRTGRIGQSEMQGGVSSKYVALPAGVFSGMTKGTVMIYCALRTANRRILTTQNTAAVSGPYLTIHFLTGLPTTLTFATHNGVGAESIIEAVSVFAVNVWHLIGCQWGPQGKKLYLDGAISAEDSTKVAVPSGTLGSPAIGVYDLAGGGQAYGSVSFGFVGLWADQLGDGAHQAIAQWCRGKRSAWA